MSFGSDVFAAFQNSHLDGQKLYPDGNNAFAIGGTSPVGASTSLVPTKPMEFQPSQTWDMNAPTTQPNPYLGQMADAIRGQVTQNLDRNILPQIRGNFQSIGGFGGSRQGVVEANALNDANQGLSNALANLYGTDWTNAQNRGLQQQQISNAYDLGLGNLGLGFGNLGLGQQNSMQNFYTAQRGQDLQAAGLGSQLVNSGNQNFINQGQGIYGIGNVYQQAPWGTIGGFNSAISPYTGLGTTTTQNQQSPLGGFLGGALGGAQLFSMF